MREIPLSAEALISALLDLEPERNLCLLDSCGVPYLGSRLMIAGFDPVEVIETSDADPEKTLQILDQNLSDENRACIFTISYEFGLKLNKIVPRVKEFPAFNEPDIFLAAFDCLIVHDYQINKTFLTGNQNHFNEIEKTLLNATNAINAPKNPNAPNTPLITSNFTKEKYLEAVRQIQEDIRNGDTYQTNLTQQLRLSSSEKLSPAQIFSNLRTKYPVPFAAFIRRKNDAVISASPERFFKVESQESRAESRELRTENQKSEVREPKTKDQRSKIKDQRSISVSPIKGTRPRGNSEAEDLRLQNELLQSDKDRAENIMIVDLLRNDIGRICRFGSVAVEKLCELEIHPTLFHLVSTVRGELRQEIRFSDILKAAFPCGSITGAPKIRTMSIIDRLETAPRGLSMGAIGYSVQSSKFEIQSSIDLSVAIRTMVIRENEAIFNVGGGIVIDSEPENEYQETLVKARALLQAAGARQNSLDN